MVNQPDPNEIGDADPDTGYVYTDPVADDTFPRIVEAVDLDDFPEGWGAAPTERDQAAIDAGNA